MPLTITDQENLETENIAEENQAEIEIADDENLESESENEEINFVVAEKETENLEKEAESDDDFDEMYALARKNTIENLEHEAENNEERDEFGNFTTEECNVLEEEIAKITRFHELRRVPFGEQSSDSD